jgi:hypothetical protein
MIDQKLINVFEEDKQVTEPTVKVTVELSLSDVMTEMASALLDEVIRLTPPRMKDVENLEVGDILHYLNTLVWMRTIHVTHNRFPTGKEDYFSLYREVTVPTLLYQVLICIGKAHDDDYGIEFVPSVSFEADMLLAPSEMKVVSDLLYRIEANGLMAVNGLPKDKEGELGFMAMQHVSGQVTSYRKDHPVYGFLASFFTQETLNEVTGSMSRVIYGYEQDYKYRVRRLIRKE